MVQDTDTNFAHGNGSVDPAFEQMRRLAESTPEPERQVGSEPLPGFKYYVLAPVSGQGKIAKSGLAQANFNFIVKAGPKGTVGRHLNFQSLPLEAKTTEERENPDTHEKTVVPRSEKDLLDAQTNVARGIARVVGRCGFNQAYPSSLRDQESLDIWASQIVNSPDLVAEVRVRKGNENFDPSNNINWLSLARVTDPAKNKAGEVIQGKTCLDEAIEEIAKYDAKGHSKGGPRGNRAASVGAAMAPASSNAPRVI